jgi:hypothetical protein
LALLIAFACPWTIIASGILLFQLVEFNDGQGYTNGHQQKSEDSGIYQIKAHRFLPISAHNLK